MRARASVAIATGVIANFKVLLSKDIVQFFKPALRISLYIVCLLVGANTHAATQGNRGATSTGTVDLTVVVGELALINGLNDLDLGSWPGSGDLSDNDDFCVAVTGALFNQPKTYMLRASGDGDTVNPSAFTLSNGVSDIYYRVFLTDLNGQIELLPGQIASGNEFFADITYILNLIIGACIFPNANIEVVTEEAQLATGAGTHAGTLTLELIPE